MQPKIFSNNCYKSLHFIANSNKMHIQYVDYQYLMKFRNIENYCCFIALSGIFHCNFFNLILYQIDKNKKQNTS